MTKTRTVWDRLFAIAVACLLALVGIRPFFLPVEQGDHYLYLAEHQVFGDLTVNDIPSTYGDVVTWQGNKYLPFGPLPAVLAIPFLPFLQLVDTRDIVFIGIALTYSCCCYWIGPTCVKVRTWANPGTGGGQSLGRVLAIQVDIGGG